ncbi:MAG: hypothetical protein E7H37_06645, partial [Enterococcus faecalis]|nr:hypothetical protein [Enterococcus faecalis]
MRSVRYATASSFYHKKITLITALFFFLFSFLLTGLFNLIDFEKEFLRTMPDFVDIEKQTSYHYQLIQYYWHLYLGSVIFFGVTFLLLMYVTLRIKKEEIHTWYHMHFSNMYVTKQLLLELCLPALLGIFSFLLFTLMFQETYNTVLWAARDAILQWSHLETPAFLAKSTDQDVTITNIQHLGIQTIQAFSFDFKSMQSLYTIRNCFVNCLILLGI